MGLVLEWLWTHTVITFSIITSCVDEFLGNYNSFMIPTMVKHKEGAK